MRRVSAAMAARLFLLLVLGAALLPFQAAVADADDGPPRTLLSAAGRLRPSETIERVASAGVLRVLVTISGYGADVRNDAGYWAPLARALPDMRAVEYGNDFGQYDTRGSIAANAAALVRDIDRLSREEDPELIAIVGVSQGGVVAAEAARSAHLSRDNVTSITTLGSPLNGSTAAQIVLDADAVATAAGAHRELSDIVAPLGVGLDDAALPDLARRKEFTSPADVHFTQFSATLDELVFDRDSNVVGRVRTVSPLPPGAHGGQLSDARTLAMVVDAVHGKDVKVSPLET